MEIHRWLRLPVGHEAIKSARHVPLETMVALSDNPIINIIAMVA